MVAIKKEAKIKISKEEKCGGVCENCTCKKDTNSTNIDNAPEVLYVLVYTLCTFAILYLLGSFVEGSRNILNWAYQTKFYIGIVTFFVFFILILFNSIKRIQ